MKILVGYDDSEVCNNALKLAKKHAEAFKGEVIALTSLSVPDTIETEEAERNLVAAGQIFNDGLVPFSTEISVRGMYPAEDILRFAQENEIDEIIIGVQNRSRVGKLIFGSTAQNIILNAICPVVVVK